MSDEFRVERITVTQQNVVLLCYRDPLVPRYPLVRVNYRTYKLVCAFRKTKTHKGSSLKIKSDSKLYLKVHKVLIESNYFKIFVLLKFFES